MTVIPPPQWLHDYTTPRLRLDVIAGLSLAAFAIPESLAYASLAELPPISGLYCYLVAGIAYAIFGSSRQLAVGPTSALAIAVAASIAALGGGDTARVAALGAGVAMLVGLIGLSGRFVGLANAAYFLSDTVVTGFKTGAAVYIASTQLPKLLGLEGVRGSFFDRMIYVVHSLPDTHLPSFAVGAGAVLLFLVLEWALPGRPTTLLVVGVSIAGAKVLGFQTLGIHVVGALPTGLPSIGMPAINLSDLTDLVPAALACFLLAYGESISVARSFAQKHGYEIDPDRELTAMGAANVATGLAQGFPVAGGMSQTAINDMGGATSPASLVVASGAIALTLLYFAGLFEDMPEPVLGAIVLMAAKHLVKLEELKALRAASRVEFRIALIALAGVLALGLLNGLLLAALGSLIVLIARAARPAIVLLARDPSGRFINRERLAAAEEMPGTLVLRSAGAWVYFNGEHIRRQILQMVDGATAPVRTLVLDCSMVPMIDLQAAASLRILARLARERGIALHLAGLRDDVAEQLRTAGGEADLGEIVAHRTIEDCLAGVAAA
jgi:high affinity sulfate transporter 1